jgi:hypothetical protein
MKGRQRNSAGVYLHASYVGAKFGFFHQSTLRHERRSTHAHRSRAVAMMKNQSKGFSHGIGGVDGTTDVFKEHVPLSHPIIEGKVLNIDVMASISGAARVGHHYGSRIVLKQRHGVEL